MPDFTVDNNTRLDTFLRRKRVQQWRIPILAAKGGVVVVRGGQRSSSRMKKRASSPATKSPLSPRRLPHAPRPCRRRLLTIGATTPSPRATRTSTSGSRSLSACGTARSSSSRRCCTPSRGGWRDLATSDEITHPIRHLLFVGHGGLSGVLKGPLSNCLSAPSATRCSMTP